jgi:hypothetical protein
MTPTSLPPTPVIIASFFKRLIAIDAIIRVILNRANLSAAFTFRGDGQKKILFDFSKAVASVEVDATTHTAHIHMAIDADTMHDILLGKMKPGFALGRRQMLLRGSATNLAKFIPLFDFSPAIYREHLADTGYKGYIRKKGTAPLKEAVMSGNIFKGDPIPLTDYSLLEKITIKLINRIAFLMGYLVGVMRYRIFEKLCIFDVLSAMSKGLEAATPKKEKSS